MVLVIVLLATAAIVCTGIFVTLRSFRAENRTPVEAKPRHSWSNPHDAATTAALKHYFEGKQCASCGRTIPPVHAGELRPGLLNTNTHEAMTWDAIPAANLSATLASHVPICSNCLTIETLRRQHPELVVDRHRTIENSSH
ncbi:MAG: hypothetical protein DMF84_13020 [Acidobacteria bacterium]|nr:MAG: hypothetical protein DMF84_13020 [Acidobacteriota bacterium]